MQGQRPYKIMPGDNIIVYRRESNGNAYYKAMITKTTQDGTKERFYKELRFRKGVDLPNKTMIKIKTMFEDVRNNPKDTYTPIWCLVILDFEIVDNPYEKYDKKDIINNYNNATNVNEEVDNFLQEIEDENIEMPW